MRMLTMITALTAMLMSTLPAESQAVRLKIATLSPEGSVWMQKMVEGAEEVARKTENRVNIKFYPGGVMGDDEAVLRKIRIGQLQGGAVVGGSLSRYYQDNQIYALPMKFKSFEEIDYVRRHLDSKIMQGLEKGGFVTFGLAEGGFAYVMSTVSIRTVDDMRRQKVWVPDNDKTVLESIKAFEINPIPLSIADVRAGLQTGLINTVATPPIGAIALQWHTQIKYLMYEPFLYVYGILAVDQDVFQKLSPKDQQIFREVMERIFKELDRLNRADNIKAIEVLRGHGIEFITPNAEALKKWYQAAAAVPDRLIQAGKLSREMVETLERLIEEYRSKHP